MKIGQRIREQRQHLGISLEDLGELSQVSWTSIGKIERGAQSPNAETLVRLGTALGVDAGGFLAGVTADDYGNRLHQFTARDFIAARSQRQGIGGMGDAGDGAGAGRAGDPGNDTGAAGAASAGEANGLEDPAGSR